MATPHEIEDRLRRLAAVPERLARAVAGRTEADLRAAPADGGWSVAQTLAHLRGSDDIIAYRLSAILVRDDPPLAAYDERRWAEVAGYAEVGVRESLGRFVQKRAELVAVLGRVAPGDWDRVGEHEERGRLSLLDVATRLVAHEEEHCAQVEAAIGAAGG